MQESTASDERVLLVERINGWWVQENLGDGQHRLHGPYPDEETARNEAALLGGVDGEIAVDLPMRDNTNDHAAPPQYHDRAHDSEGSA